MPTSARLSRFRMHFQPNIVGADDPVRPRSTPHLIAILGESAQPIPLAVGADAHIGPFLRLSAEQTPEFHTPQIQGKALVAGESREPFERFSGRLFLFFTGRGGSFLSPKRERKEWGRK